MKVVRLGLLAAGVLSVVSTAFVAVADDKTFGGENCHPYFGNTSHFFLNAQGITNFSGGSAANVTCPIVRDNTTNTTGMTDLDVFVSSPAGATQGVGCTAYSYSAAGSLIDIAGASTAASGNQRIDFGNSINVSTAATATNWGTYFFLCSLNPSETVWGYRWSEP